MEPRSRTPSRIDALLARCCAGRDPDRGASPKANSKCSGSQSRLRGGDLLQPAAQVGAQAFRLHFSTRAESPARDSSSYCAATRSSTWSARSSAVRQVSVVTGSGQPLQFAEQLELHRMKKRAARQRVHLFQTGGFFARAELKDGVQQKAIRASRELLQ